MAAKKAKTSKTIKVRITAPVAGTYLLPYYVGQEVSIEEKQALELIENNYATKA